MFIPPIPLPHPPLPRPRPPLAAAPTREGGLGLTTTQLAPSLGFSGVVLMAYSLLGFPRLARWGGPGGCASCGGDGGGSPDGGWILWCWVWVLAAGLPPAGQVGVHLVGLAPSLGVSGMVLMAYSLLGFPRHGQVGARGSAGGGADWCYRCWASPAWPGGLLRPLLAFP